MYFGKNIFKTIMLKNRYIYIYWKEHIQNNNVKKIEIYILERTYSKQ